MGGSSGINAMLYVRGNAADYDEWEELGNAGWGWKSALEYFKKAEHNKIGDWIGEYHGGDGPLRVDFFSHVDSFRDIFGESATENGHLFVDDINIPNFMGYTTVQGTIHEGKRFSSAKAYLLPAKNRTNLHIIKNAHVKNINFENKKAVSVDFIYEKNEEMTVRAKKEIILSAGAIGTPQILMLSGIGPKKHLAKQEIPLVQNLPVGQNLQDHVIVPVFYRFNRNKQNTIRHDEFVNNIYLLTSQGTGPLTGHNAVDLTGFINTLDSKANIADIQLHHFSFHKKSPELKYFLETIGFADEITKSILETNEKEDVVCVPVTLLRPKSIGSIRLRSNDYTKTPKIFANYLKHQDDVDTLVRGINIANKVLDTKPFSENEGYLLRVNITECNNLKGDKYWICYTRHMSTTLYHPTSTAKMGPPGDSSAVVDPRLKVHGIEGLRVVDASIMPNIVRGNTNAPAIMIGEKASDMIKEDWSDAKIDHNEL